MSRLPLRSRALAVGLVVTLVLLSSYVVLGREHIPAVDAFVYGDPTLSFTASRSSAPPGSVIHLAGAPAGALAEFSRDGVVAYSPTFGDGAAVAAVVPPVFRGRAPASGDFKLRLLAQKGPLWGSSAKAAFVIEASPAASAPLGTATLFALEVTRGLLLHAAGEAAAAAAAGAGTAASEQAATLAESRLDTDALIAQFEAVVSGKSDRVTHSGMTIDPAGILLMDQLMASYFTSLGPASPSPCGDAKDADAQRGLLATAVSGVKSFAALVVQSLVRCDSQQTREIAQRTNAWLSALGYGMAQLALTVPELPKLAGLLLITVTSRADEGVNATYLWKQYGQGADLRAYMLERNASFVVGDGQDVYITYELALSEDGGGSVRKTVRLPDYLREAAEQDTYLSGQIERMRKQKAFENELLETVIEQDEAIQARVATALQARQSTPTTPPPSATPTASPSTTPAAPTATPAATLALVSLPPTPGPLAFALRQPPPAVEGQRYPQFTFCSPTPRDFALGACGPGTTNPTGGNPPYHFQLGSGVGFPPIGMSLGKDGQLTGTPGAGSAGRAYTFSVCAVDLSANQVCRTVTLNVNAVAAATPVPTAKPTPVPTAAPAAFSPSFQTRIKLTCGGDSRLFFTVPAGVSEALTRVSATPSTFTFSQEATRSQTIFTPCNASGTITVHRSTANAWSVTLDATITTGGYGSGVVLEVTPLGGSTSLAVSCSTSTSGGGVATFATVAFRNGSCATGGTYSGTNPAGADTFGNLIVRDLDKGPVSGATGRAQITFTLTPN